MNTPTTLEQALTLLKSLPAFRCREVTVVGNNAKKVQIAVWNHADDCGEGEYIITLTHYSEVGSWMWWPLSEDCGEIKEAKYSTAPLI